MDIALKTCTLCKQSLPASAEHFYADQRNKNKFRPNCRPCHNRVSSQTKDRQRARENDRNRYASLSAEDKARVIKNASDRCKTEESKEYRRLHLKRWRAKNPDKRRAQEIRYEEKNPEKIRIKRARSSTKKRSTIEGRLNSRMSSRLRNYIKRKKAGSSWVALVGYSAEELKPHIEKQFLSGMSWDLVMNGSIHIDHIIPLANFEFKSVHDQEFKQAWALTNLRPLWAIDNLKKSSKRLFLL